MQADIYEYAISAGEGTLLALGQCDGEFDLLQVFDELAPGQTLALSMVDADCETGL